MDQDTEMHGSGRKFQSTCWGLVRSAATSEGMDQLIRIYWKPLYFYVRKRGYDNETAKDLVQDFLSNLIERNAILKADPARGRFRSFLLSSLANHIADWERSTRSLKRGGREVIESLDFRTGEEEFSKAVSQEMNPEWAADSEWARGVFMRCLGELQGDPRHIQALALRLKGEEYDAVAVGTGLSAGAAQVAIHRLCKQFGELLRGHLKPFSASEQELEDDISDFLQLISCKPSSHSP